jgi:hypothetical protein
MRLTGEALTSLALFDEGFGLLHCCEPIETHPKGFADQCLTIGVMPIGAFGNVTQDVLPLLGCDSPLEDA